MANRRMFSKSIIRTDRFLEMASSTQNLYFHLGIEADDDGFVSPKMVMRTVGATDDELKMLIAKRFVIPFESGVVVITDWKENNYIQSDRHKPTIHQQELLQLSCTQNVYKLDTQVRLGEVRKGKVDSEVKTSLSEVVDFYLDIKKMGKPPRSVYGKYLRPAKELLELAPLEEIKKRIKDMDKWATQHDLSWNLNTVIKRWQEDSTPEKASVVNVDEIIRLRRLQENG